MYVSDSMFGWSLVGLVGLAALGELSLLSVLGRRSEMFEMKYACWQTLVLCCRTDRHPIRQSNRQQAATSNRPRGGDARPNLRCLHFARLAGGWIGSAEIFPKQNQKRRSKNTACRPYDYRSESGATRRHRPRTVGPQAT
jgi:hypothetical protein